MLSTLKKKKISKQNTRKKTTQERYKTHVCTQTISRGFIESFAIKNQNREIKTQNLYQNEMCDKNTIKARIENNA